MPALSFKKTAVPLIRKGIKTRTCRRKRKNPIKAGDELQLYVGMRTAQCKRIGTGRCRKVQDVEIDRKRLRLDGRVQGFDRREIFAHEEGCGSWDEFVDIIDAIYGIPFEGVMIQWKLIDPSLPTE